MNKKAQLEIFGSELSFAGLAGAIFGVVFLFITHKWMLGSFLEFYGTTGKIIMTITVYIGTAIAGYMIASKIIES